MALKADRNELDVDISYFMNETAEKGQIVCISTVGSGAAMDQAGALVVKRRPRYHKYSSRCFAQ